MTTAIVLENDTLGSFCQRHNLLRETVFAANPHLLARRIFVEHVPTAELFVGEELSTEVPAFIDLTKADYDKVKSCIDSGGIGDSSNMQQAQCKKLYSRNGSYFVEIDGKESHLNPGEAKLVAGIQQCFQKDGFPLVQYDQLSCFPTTTKTMADGKEVFGADTSNKVAIDATTPKAEDKPCGEVYSKTTIGLIWGGLFLGGLAVGKFLL